MTPNRAAAASGVSLRPGLAQDPVQNRVHVGGEVANLPAQIHDDGQGESGQDGQVLLDLDQRGRGRRHGGAASRLPHPYYEGHSWTTNVK